MKHKKPTRSKKPVFVALGVAAAAIIAVVILEVTDTTHFFHEAKPATTASQYTKGEQQAPNNDTNSNSKDPQQANGNESKDSGGSTNPDPNVVLLEPTGDFVSNHRPNLSGSPAPNIMTSVCTSTPGAKCTISFTKGSEVKSLEVQTTDAGGSAYWNWKLQDIGLSEGSWKVSATATLGSQTKIANDALALEVAK